MRIRNVFVTITADTEVRFKGGLIPTVMIENPVGEIITLDADAVFDLRELFVKGLAAVADWERQQRLNLDSAA